MSSNPSNYENEKHKAVDRRTTTSEYRSATYETHSASKPRPDDQRHQEGIGQAKPSNLQRNSRTSNSYSSSFARTTGSKSNIRIIPIVIITIIVLIGIAFFISRIANKPDNKNDDILSNVESSEYKETSSEKTETDEHSDSSVEENERTTDLDTAVQSILNIEGISESKNAIDKIDIQKISDKITSEKERKAYDITTVESGRYRFELSEIANNVYFKMFLYNADMEELKYEEYQANGGGITYDLNANTLYHIVIEQQKNTGSFMLSIGSQKATVDISEYTTLSDSIQFTHQRNVYSFTSKEHGRYRFELSEIANNVYFKMFLYNADMEELKYEEYQANGGGITYDLNANTLYHLVIEQQKNTGSYMFSIGSQKATEDISGYNCLSDSIQFTHQRNVYSFTSSVAANYKFELSDVSNDVYFKMFIYNADMEELKYAEYQANGGNVNFELKPNSPYYIVVEQQKNKGHYLMSYGIANEN